jgi:hypothetical protein
MAQVYEKCKAEALITYIDGKQCSSCGDRPNFKV